jgi:hypothetical protein
MSIHGDNWLENTNWQLCSKIYPYNSPATVTAMKPDGSGLQDRVFVNTFPTGQNRPILTVTNTGQLQEGSLISFGQDHGGFSGVTGALYTLRVRNLLSNASFQINLPFNATSPGSSSLWAYPVGISDLGVSTKAPDGWTKTQSLVMWIDDFTVNRCPGAKRVLGLRKGVSTVEKLIWKANAATLGALRGRKVSLAGMFRQKVGSGSSVLTIDDGVSPASSMALTGAAYVNSATNNYEFRDNDAYTVNPNATSLTVTFDFAGSVGDIVYVGTPTLKYGCGMTPDCLGQPRQEIIAPDNMNHWNPPSLTPFTNSWPTTPLFPGTSLYGFVDLDIEALSWGQCHSSIREVHAKIELTTTFKGEIFFSTAFNPDGATQADAKLVFGPQQTTQDSGIMITSGPSFLPLRPGTAAGGSQPGCIAIFGVIPGHHIQYATFDMDKVMA